MDTWVGIGRNIFLPGCLLEAESLAREVSRVGGLGDVLLNSIFTPVDIPNKQVQSVNSQDYPTSTLQAIKMSSVYHAPQLFVVRHWGPLTGLHL